ncbi:MAG: epoxide hydrolase [Patulibacter sp.]|nr:epoxide hydrolase family protein [Patulibacter sp.]MDO9407447.1 epoxide hydrolase [Patulibacter sp.]
MSPALLRPFTVAVPDADLEDLRRRLRDTRWPERETVEDWSQGVPLAYLQEVCATWADAYDWRAVEARLNAHEQHLATVDGLDLHVVHVPSPEPGARPLVLTHGWPGSVLEFLDVVGPLSDPVAHGGDAADAFHVVLPSLPGYGFSGRPTGAGWGLERIASAWVAIVEALGYDRFLAQGGDWGSGVTHRLATAHADRVEGIHLNLPACSPKALLALGEPTEEERGQLAKLEHYATQENGYAQEQSTKPQTVGYALADSPVGQCAWILEKFRTWTDCDGHPENAVSRDALLDAISLYWLTNTGASSARLYWESFGRRGPKPEPVEIPVGYTLFPEDIFAVSERWARTRYRDLRHYSRVERGGHFAAMEQPAVFVDEVRAAFATMR